MRLEESLGRKGLERKRRQVLVRSGGREQRGKG